MCDVFGEMWEVRVFCARHKIGASVVELEMTRNFFCVINVPVVKKWYESQISFRQNLTDIGRIATFVVPLKSCRQPLFNGTINVATRTISVEF